MKVYVSKERLIAKLAENRDLHREVFLRAMDGFQRECIHVLEENLKHYRNPQGVKRQLYLHEQMPVDHTRDYDTVIGLMRFAEGESVELSAAEYRQYIMDDWEWKQQWTASTTKYLDGVLE